MLGLTEIFQKREENSKSLNESFEESIGSLPEFLSYLLVSYRWRATGEGGVRNRERENSEIFRRSLVIYINVLSRVPARVSPSSTHDRNRRGKRTRALIIRSENAPSSRLASLSPPSSLRVYPKRDV